MSSKTPEEVYEHLKKEFGDQIIQTFFDPAKDPETDPKKKHVGDCYIVVQPGSITKVCEFLRNNSDLHFDSLSCLGSVDDTSEKPAYVVVYNLFSFKHRHHVTLKVKLPKDNPKVPSVQGIWSGANWFEREAFDLMGITFENHPDLRRLLLPPDWVGHPMRKDYEFPAEYNGISCTRPKLK